MMAMMFMFVIARLFFIVNVLHLHRPAHYHVIVAILVAHVFVYNDGALYMRIA
jgi:hypothetical protein